MDLKTVRKKILKESYNMLLKVSAVQSKAEFIRFIKLPRMIYKNQPQWVEPLIMDMKYNLKHSPFWEHAEQKLFIVYDVETQEPLGRIAAIIDHNYNAFHKTATGFFGFFEAYNDVRIARALVDEASNWLRSKGMNKILGPCSPSTNDLCGFLSDGFDSSPMFMMHYNPAYYLDLIQSVGFVECKQLYAYQLPSNNYKNLEILQKISDRVKKRLKNFNIRPINMNDFDNEISHAVNIYNQAWSENWGFVPWTEEEFGSAVKQMKSLIVKDLILFATIDDKPIGFIVACPDYNVTIKKLNGNIFPFGFLKLLLSKNKTKDVRVLIMGVVNDYRLHGVDVALINELWKNGIRLGYNTFFELSWVLDDNYNMIKLAMKLQAKQYKTYKLYDFELK